MSEYAGFQLLDRFERGWNQIHKDGVENVDGVKKLTKALSDVGKKIAKTHNSFDRFNQQMKTVPAMIESVDKIIVSLGKLQADFSNVEDILNELQSIKREEHQVENMRKKNEELHTLKLKRQKELEDLKVSLAREHSLLLEKIDKERKERKAETERQLEEAFLKSDLKPDSNINTGELKDDLQDELWKDDESTSNDQTGPVGDI